ncbi:YchJ family protein [Jannaschia sp. R86511]|uniref:YchJ family protein n=1 Tax=Jannaschia sp. R86511 TaxID=3093853 RepID=UPI0036D2EC54
MPRCPCLSGLPFDDCCAPVHIDHARAATAEQLMRSRFSAFAVGDEAHLLRTWHPSTRPPGLGLDPTVRWYRLDVLATTAGGRFDDEGAVEFEAFHRSPEARGSQHEVSRFVREDGRWYYLDGVGRR